MQRSRLKNIINKSQELSNLKIGDSYDLFVKSLPSELDYYKDGSKYRLKAAWKAYGSPKDYQGALWNGLVETIGGSLKMPSVGYNEETDSYEYLNIGKDNDIVNKDIRAWDNDVIPFIKELKHGGYVRTFDEENNFWKYSKNQSQTQNQERNEINFFKNGGSSKKSYSEWIKTVPQDRLSDNYDLETAYQYLPIEELEKWRTATPEQLNDESYHLRSVAPYGDEDYIFLKKGREWMNPEVQKELNSYYSGQTGLQFSHDLIFDDDQNRYFYKKKRGFNPQAFKQGGQMNVIPEGALHARKNNMEGAGKDYTSKGIPVVDNEGNQTAEIEKEEIIFNKETTDKLEELYKKFNSEGLSQSEKDEIAIKAGKLLSKQIIENTEDNTGLIQEVANK